MVNLITGFVLVVSSLYGAPVLHSQIQNAMGENSSDFETTQKFDSLNVGFVGNWPFGPCYAVTKDSSRNQIFCGSGGGVYILDATDPDSLKEISEDIHTRGIVRSMTLVDNYLYLAADRAGFEIWDVHNATNPMKLGSCATTGPAFDLAVAEKCAYVIDTLGGFEIIDISNPNAPHSTGYWRDTVNTIDIEKVRTQGSYLYAYFGYGTSDSVLGSGIMIFNITDPNKPVKAGEYREDGAALRWDEIKCADIAISGQYAYMATWQGYFYIIDISNPAAPKKTGECFTAFKKGHHALAISGDYAYEAGAQFTTLRAINISDPSHPYEWGFVPLSPPTDGAVGLTILNRHAYVAYAQISSRGMPIVDISDPFELIWINNYSVPLQAFGVAVAGNYAYVADSYSGLRVIDIANPFLPREVGNCNYCQGAAFDIAIKDNYAYVVVTVWSDTSDTSGLFITDVTEPASPSVVGYALLPSERQLDMRPSFVALSDHYAYILCERYFWIFDVANKTAPTEKGRLAIGLKPLRKGIVIVGKYAYLYGSPGIWIVDISNPAAPQKVGSFLSDKTVYNLIKIGNYLYALVNPQNLIVFDLNDPLAPRQIANYQTRYSSPAPMDYWENYVYAMGTNPADPTSPTDGLEVIDISNPASPQRVGYYDCPTARLAFQLGDLAASGQYIYAANDEYGLEIYSNSLLGVTEKDRRYAKPAVEFELLANPVRHFVNSRVILNTSSDLRYKFYNLLGQNVKTVFQGWQEAGVHEIKFSTDGLAAGVYFIHIETGNSFITRPVIILK
jgi:hypothetical protein